MRRFLFGLLIVISPLTTQGADCISSLAEKINKNELWLIGESHYILEKDSFQLRLLKSCLQASHEPLTLYLEFPRSFSPIFENVKTEVDQMYALNGMRHYFELASGKTHEEWPDYWRNSFDYFKLLISLKSQHANFEIRCIDREKYPHASAWQISQMLYNAGVPEDEFNPLEAVSMDEIDLLKTKDVVTAEIDRLQWRSFVKDSTILQTIQSILIGLKPLLSLSTERENLLADNIKQWYRSDGRNIAFLGNRHINKWMDPYDDFDGNRESVGTILFQDLCFKGKATIKSVFCRYLEKKSSKGTWDERGASLFLSPEEAMISSRQLEQAQVSCVLQSTVDFHRANKAYDFLLVFRSGTLWY